MMRTLPKSIEARTFFDPDADRNLSNALPTPARKPRKAATVAPRGWSLIPEYVAPAETPVAPVDAMTVCNGCEVRPMVASEHPGYAAGLCAECYADAIAPEPETPAEVDTAAEPEYRTPAYHETIDHYESDERPDVCAEPEPVAAPVLTVVPSRSRPTCERCGQSFRVSGTGYAWHVANRPDCASKRLAVVA